MGEAEASILVRRTSLLLRCQTAREASMRRVLGRALRARAEAAGALVQARQAMSDRETSRRIEMIRRYAALEGKRVDASTLQALPAIEARLREEAIRLSGAVASAATKLRHAAAAEFIGRERLVDAARVTRRRERLAENAAGHLRRARAAADDVERDDSASEAWRAAPPGATP